MSEGSPAIGATVRTLQVGQHVLAGLLAVVCTVRALQDGALWIAQVLVLAALVGWYAYGIRLARTRSVSGSWWWLAGLILGWVVLVLVSPENVWLAFSIWLLVGHLLPLVPALVVSAAVLAVVVLEPVRQSGQISFAAAVGPSLGCLIALGVARAQGRLVRDVRERQELIARLVAAQEESAALSDELASTQREAGVLAERTRLSRDIHDTIAQDFTSILLLVRTGDASVLPQVEAVAAEGLDEARRLVAELAPSGLDDGLAGALRRLVERLHDEAGIEAEVRIDGTVDRLPTAIEVALLRTAQGALANARSHSAATHLVVTLSSLTDASGRPSVRLDVVDDGVGFDPTRTDEGMTRSPLRGGYGLTAMRSRLRELGGSLEVESAPGEGTALSASIPLTAGGER